MVAVLCNVGGGSFLLGEVNTDHMGKVRRVRDETRVLDGTGARIASMTAGIKGMVAQLSHHSNWK